MIRAFRTEEGVDQSALADSKTAFHVPGISAAIYSPGDKRIYVGQSIHTCTHRFEQHVRKSRNDGKDRINGFIRQKGFYNCFVFPLEVIDPTLYNGHAPSRLSKFHAAATPREIFWIKRLHTGQLRTGGLNTSFGTWKRRVHFGNNPMKWRRAKISALGLLKTPPSLKELHLKTVKAGPMAIEIGEDIASVFAP